MSIAVFAIDPGKTTGLAWGVFKQRKTTALTLTSGKHMGGTQVQAENDVFSAEEVMGHLDEFMLHVGEDVPIWIVVEDFILRPQAATQDRGMLTPVRLTGLIQGMWWERQQHDHTFSTGWTLQMPSEAKGFATNERLARWGVKTQGRHSKDAWRHIAVFLAKDASKQTRSN